MELISHDCNIFDKDTFLTCEVFSKSWCITKVCTCELEGVFISLSTVTVCGVRAFLASLGACYMCLKSFQTSCYTHTGGTR